VGINLLFHPGKGTLVGIYLPYHPGRGTLVGIYHPVHTLGGTMVGIHPLHTPPYTLLVGSPHPEVHP